MPQTVQLSKLQRLKQSNEKPICTEKIPSTSIQKVNQASFTVSHLNPLTTCTVLPDFPEIGQFPKSFTYADAKNVHHKWKKLDSEQRSNCQQSFSGAGFPVRQLL